MGSYWKIFYFCWVITFFNLYRNDETARVFTSFEDETNENDYYEIARPQIHGYSVKCIAFLHNYGFISGSDEKIMRVFEAPQNFVDSLSKIKNISSEENKRVCDV